MGLRLARYVLLGKLEPIASYGEDPTPVVADDVIQARNITLTPEYNPQNIPRGDRGFWYKTLPGAQLKTLSFDVPLTKALVNATAGEITKLLDACAYKEKTAEVNEFDTIEEYNATNSSMYFYFYNDGILEKLSGARGTATFRLEAGLEAMVHFEFTGLYVSGSAVSCPEVTAYKSGTMYVVKGSTLTLGANYHSSFVEFTDGNTLTAIRDASGVEGIYRIEVASANARGTLDTLVETANAATLEALVENGTPATITYEAIPAGVGADDKNPVITIGVIIESYTRVEEGGYLRYLMSFVITSLDIDLEITVI